MFWVTFLYLPKLTKTATNYSCNSFNREKSINISTLSPLTIHSGSKFTHHLTYFQTSTSCTNLTFFITRAMFLRIIFLQRSFDRHDIVYTKLFQSGFSEGLLLHNIYTNVINYKVICFKYQVLNKTFYFKFGSFL